MKLINTTIKSIRNTDIPVSIVDAEVDNAGLVIFAHGFKADRHEGGRFTRLANMLSKIGISSIRLGFPGCDESKEEFYYYTLTNCLNDLQTCYDYMKTNYSINENKMGLVGYSMGGRLVSLFIKNHPEFKVIGLWAPACLNDFINDDFLGCNVTQMKKQAKEKGYIDFNNIFDNTILKMNVELIHDMENLHPNDGLNSFEGRAIIIHGDKDSTVKPFVSSEVYKQLINAKDKKLVVIKDADHGFGLWDKHPEQSIQLIEETYNYFEENL